MSKIDETPLQAVERLGLLVLEPRSTFDRALIGVEYAPKDHWPRRPNAGPVAAYSYDACVDALMAVEGWSCTDAIDWVEYNTAGTWVGDQTPILVRRGKALIDLEWSDYDFGDEDER